MTTPLIQRLAHGEAQMLRNASKPAVQCKDIDNDTLFKWAQLIREARHELTKLVRK